MMDFQIELDAEDQKVLAAAYKACLDDVDEGDTIGETGWRAGYQLSAISDVYNWSKLINAGLLERDCWQYRITNLGISTHKALVEKPSPQPAAKVESAGAVSAVPSYGFRYTLMMLFDLLNSHAMMITTAKQTALHQQIVGCRAVLAWHILNTQPVERTSIIFRDLEHCIYGSYKIPEPVSESVEERIARLEAENAQLRQQLEAERQQWGAANARATRLMVEVEMRKNKWDGLWAAYQRLTKQFGVLACAASDVYDFEFEDDHSVHLRHLRRVMKALKISFSRKVEPSKEGQS